ncbi:MAG: hypothetical protein JNM72_14415 [Deltaproteobacteria bacterium]|nr:hypothetical protein [Deltaproteobacteria bacterium]
MSWEERLALLKPSLAGPAVAHPGQVEVEETADDGAMCYRHPVPAGWEGRPLYLDGIKNFGFLQDQKNADGHIILSADGQITQVVLVECKLTLTIGMLKTALRQLRAATTRTELLLRYWQEPAWELRFIVATTSDRTTAERSANPRAGALPVGTSDEDLVAAYTALRTKQVRLADQRVISVDVVVV